MQPHFHKLLKYALIWQIALTLYWLALFVTTHIPSRLATFPGASTDKLVHLSAFAMLALLLATAWQLSMGQFGLRHAIVAWIVLVLYGALDEWTQTFVGRQASLYDLLGDAIGALIGLAFFSMVRRLLGGKLQRAPGSESPNQ
jgi:VanZ family protein